MLATATLHVLSLALLQDYPYTSMILDQRGLDSTPIPYSTAAYYRTVSATHPANHFADSF
jgi:hypothetical protein